MAEHRPGRPDGPERTPEPADESDDRKKVIKKKPAKRKPEAAQAEEAERLADERTDDTEPAESPEQLEQEVMSEREFRQRVALAELANRLSPETYAAIERILARLGGDWSLEKGRYLYTYLVGERQLSVRGADVAVEHRLAIRRDEEPAEPEEIEQAITDVLDPEHASADNVARLEPVRELLTDEDEVRIRLDSEKELQELVVTREAVSVIPVDRWTPSEAAPETTPETTVPKSATPETRPGPATPEPAPEAEPPTRAEIETIVQEVDTEPEEVPVPPAKPDRLVDVLIVLDQKAEDLNDLPPIAGGAPEAGELGGTEPAAEEVTSETLPEDPEALIQELLEEKPVPEEPIEFPPLAPEQPDRPNRPRRRSRRRTPDLEIEAVETVRYPDARMRRKGRKLIRRIARRFGIKLTPDLEAYLLAILLRPKFIHGRKVFGLGVNLDHLINVMGVIKQSYGHEWRKGFW